MQNNNSDSSTEVTKKDTKSWVSRVVFFLLFVLVLLYIGFGSSGANLLLFPISIFALLCGLFYEYRKLSENWKIVLYSALISFFVSVLFSISKKNALTYEFEHDMKYFTFVFCFIFSFSAVIMHNEKIIPKLAEGITLLQSIAIIYSIIDYGFIYTDNPAIILLVMICLLFSIYSMYHAFSYKSLSDRNRFILSIWSSLIMAIFSIDNILCVYQEGYFESTSNLSYILVIVIQYFFLGISFIYIVQNFFMLIGFLPGKGEGDEYFVRIKKLRNEHILRFSTIQVNKFHSLLGILFLMIIFGLNYYTNILPRSSVIWGVFVLFPILLDLYEQKFKNHITTNTGLA